jgi:uncharacterized protein (TIGR02145 family)
MLKTSTIMKSLFIHLLVVIIGTGTATFSQTQKTEAPKSSLAQWIHSNGSGNFTETETKSLNNKPIWIESGHFNFEEMSRTKFEVLLKDLNGRNEMQIKIENNACFWKYSNEINWIPLYNGGWVVNPTIDSSINTGVNNIKDDNNTPLSTTNTLISQNIKPLPNNSSNENEVINVNANNYNTITIGTQVWMKENLNVTTFRNGDPIPEAKSDEEWESASNKRQPAWCYYDRTPPIANSLTMNGIKCNDTIHIESYGKLYNWYAANDPRGLAPKGFHVPTNEDWEKLIDFYGGYKVAGKKMKSTNGWNEYMDINSKVIKSGNGSIKHGFTGFPGGYRNDFGTFRFLGDDGVWWGGSNGNIDAGWCLTLMYLHNEVTLGGSSKGDGFSVRCLKD